MTYCSSRVRGICGGNILIRTSCSVSHGYSSHTIIGLPPASAPPPKLDPSPASAPPPKRGGGGEGRARVQLGGWGWSSLGDGDGGGGKLRGWG